MSILKCIRIVIVVLKTRTLFMPISSISDQNKEFWYKRPIFLFVLNNRNRSSHILL